MRWSPHLHYPGSLKGHYCGTYCCTRVEATATRGFRRARAFPIHRCYYLSTNDVTPGYQAALCTQFYSNVGPIEGDTTCYPSLQHRCRSTRAREPSFLCFFSFNFFCLSFFSSYRLWYHLNADATYLLVNIPTLLMVKLRLMIATRAYGERKLLGGSLMLEKYQRDRSCASHWP